MPEEPRHCLLLQHCAYCATERLLINTSDGAQACFYAGPATSLEFHVPQGIKSLRIGRDTAKFNHLTDLTDQRSSPSFQLDFLLDWDIKYRFGRDTESRAED